MFSRKFIFLEIALSSYFNKFGLVLIVLALVIIFLVRGNSTPKLFFSSFFLGSGIVLILLSSLKIWKD